LQKHFAAFGEVSNLEITWTRRLGRTFGAAVLEMPIGQGLAAARALNGQAFRGRSLYITLMGESVGHSHL